VQLDCKERIEFLLRSSWGLAWAQSLRISDLQPPVSSRDEAIRQTSKPLNPD